MNEELPMTGSEEQLYGNSETITANIFATLKRSFCQRK
jgi:hypothetical protein